MVSMRASQCMVTAMSNQVVMANDADLPHPQAQAEPPDSSRANRVILQII